MKKRWALSWTFAAILSFFIIPVCYGESILAFGDSITQGWPYLTEPGGGRSIGGYIPELQILLTNSGRSTTVKNYGYGGENTIAGLPRLDTIIREASGDTTILIMEGTNDIWYGIPWHTTVYNLGLMIDKCLLASIKPIIATLSPDSRSFAAHKHIAETYNTGIRELAVQKKVVLCDQYKSLITTWMLLSTDGLHPNTEGYAVMADTWYTSIIEGKPYERDKKFPWLLFLRVHSRQQIDNPIQIEGD